MFGPPGHAYVYFIYGMHHCLNVVTEAEGTGAAVLVRGVEGIGGPGRVAKAYGITLAMNGWDLTGSELRIGEGPDVLDEEVVVSPRVGIRRSAELPLRFRWRGHAARRLVIGLAG